MKKEAVGLTLVVALLALAAPAWAQEKEEPAKTPPEGRVSKVIPVKYADVRSVRNLITSFGASISFDSDLKVITASGNASAVAAVEDAIRTLDVPPSPRKDIQLTVYILAASQQPAPNGNTPAELGEVVGQLKRVLSYQGFQLLNTVLLRTQDGRNGRVEGVVPDGEDERQKADFKFSFQDASIIPEGKTRSVRIGRILFTMQRHNASPNDEKELTASAGPAPAVINTDIDLNEGQKVVVGKTTFASPNNALILVLMAKVVD